MKKWSLLIDGNSLMYKAFHASYFSWLKEQEAKEKEAEMHGLDYVKPEANNAIRIFTMMMISLRKKFNNHNVLVAFDAKGVNTYRTKFDYYKAGRAKTPDDLYVQKPSILKVLNLLGFKHVEDKSLEADDIIGILSNRYSNKGINVDIVTGDKDLLQLVNSNVNVHISKKGVSEMTEYNNENFKELTNGLSPEQIKDLKGIMGDSSDNLSGIKGIGEKGALKLLNEYDTLEEVYENRTEFSASICKKIEEGYEHGLECKTIATIITDHSFELSYEETLVNNLNNRELANFLRSKNIFRLAEDIEDLEW